MGKYANTDSAQTRYSNLLKLPHMPNPIIYVKIPPL